MIGSTASVLHLLLALAAVATALWSWWSAGRAEAGAPGAALSFARATTSFATVAAAQLVAGLWALGQTPLARGRALLGGELLPTAALIAALVTCVSAMRLGWTAHRRPRPRRTAAALALHLAALGLCMGVMAEALGRAPPAATQEQRLPARDRAGQP